MSRAICWTTPIWCASRSRITLLSILRTVRVPKNAPNPEGGTALLQYLLSGPAQAPSAHLHSIRLDSGLLVFGDQLRRTGLLTEWSAAMSQP